MFLSTRQFSALPQLTVQAGSLRRTNGRKVGPRIRRSCGDCTDILLVNKAKLGFLQHQFLPTLTGSIGISSILIGRLFLALSCIVRNHNLGTEEQFVEYQNLISPETWKCQFYLFCFENLSEILRMIVMRERDKQEGFSPYYFRSQVLGTTNMWC